jgi:hypothetical protein
MMPVADNSFHLIMDHDEIYGGEKQKERVSGLGSGSASKAPSCEEEERAQQEAISEYPRQTLQRRQS